MRELSTYRAAILHDDDLRIYLALKSHLEQCSSLINHDASEFSLGFYDDDDQIPEEQLVKGDLYVACLDLVPVDLARPSIRFHWLHRRAYASFGHNFDLPWSFEWFWRGTWRNSHELEAVCSEIVALADDWLAGRLAVRVKTLRGCTLAWSVTRRGKTFRRRGRILAPWWRNDIATDEFRAPNPP